MKALAVVWMEGHRLVVMLWVEYSVTGSEADSTCSLQPFNSSLSFTVFVYFFSLMIYRLSEHKTGSGERQKDRKKRERERKGGRKEGAEGADHSL